MILLQVRDYRKCASEPGSGSPVTDGCPIVRKICLRMSLENVVKDIPLISDSSWTYGDLMVSVFSCSFAKICLSSVCLVMILNRRKWSLVY